MRTAEMKMKHALGPGDTTDDTENGWAAGDTTGVGSTTGDWTEARQG